MDLRIAEGRASPKREIRSLRGRNHHRILRNNLLESIAHANGGSVVSQAADEDGVVRMKILVKKQDLRQMLEMVRGGNNKNNSVQSSSVSVEQRLNLLRRKHLLRANNAAAKENRRRSWTPALQSIPEEL